MKTMLSLALCSAALANIAPPRRAPVPPAPPHYTPPPAPQAFIPENNPVSRRAPPVRDNPSHPIKSQ